MNCALANSPRMTSAPGPDSFPSFISRGNGFGGSPAKATPATKTTVAKGNNIAPDLRMFVMIMRYTQSCDRIQESYSDASGRSHVWPQTTFLKRPGMAESLAG